MFALPDFAGRRFLVVGLGRSGRAACRSLRASGASVLAWDESENARRLASQDGIELADPCNYAGIKDLEAVVVSPGVPHLYPEPSPSIVPALDVGVPLDNDIGLFFAAIRARAKGADCKPVQVIAVTGSNGKSTTSALIHHVFRASGRASTLAGNIGAPVLDLPCDEGVVVLEVSSYQAELARCLDPDVAVFVNFSPDHLDRHGGRGGYLAAKMRLFEGPSLKKAVVGVDEVEGRVLASRIAGSHGHFTVTRILKPEAACSDGLAVAVRGQKLVEYLDSTPVYEFDLSDCASLRGQHNLQNAASAYAACRSVGMMAEEISAAIPSFPGLAHRMQALGSIQNIDFVNDSKATNPESAARALGCFKRIRWIAGGLGKEGGVASLASSVDDVIKVYLIGSSSDEFAEQLQPLAHEVCGDLSQAVRQAFKEAEPGDTVLLSPAAASFDQYDDFEQRGEHFAKEVEALKAQYFAA